MQQDFSLSAYSYNLPTSNIAQHPADARDNSRLLAVNRTTGEQHDLLFQDIIDFFSPGDLLVVNNTKVFPARLQGHKDSGGKVELFLLAYPDTENNVTCLVKSSKRPRPGSVLHLGPELDALVQEVLEDGKVLVRLAIKSQKALSSILYEYGQIPLPPYISRAKGTTEEDRQRYQTVYAQEPGAVAAPTAGLHFSESILQKLEEKGVELASITLHVGYGTFAPVRCENIKEHNIHEEFISIPDESAVKINNTRKKGGKIWAVGTTTVRTLEFMADAEGKVKAGNAWCDLYIIPGYKFKVVDNLITNFHLPESSLLFLVSALYERRQLLDVYNQAIEKGYRFYSYGDAMLIFS